MDEIYRIGKWQDYPNYECLFCPFATLDEAVAQEHYQHVHAPKIPEPPALSGLVLVADKRGNEIPPSETQTQPAAAEGTVVELIQDQIAALVEPAKRRKKRRETP